MIHICVFGLLMGICENFTKNEKTKLYILMIRTLDASWRNVQLCAKTKHISWIYKRSTELLLTSPHSALEQTVIEVIQAQISVLAGDHKKSNFSLSDIKAIHESDEDLWKSRWPQWGGMGRESSEVQAWFHSTACSCLVSHSRVWAVLCWCHSLCGSAGNGTAH